MRRRALFSAVLLVACSPRDATSTSLSAAALISEPLPDLGSVMAPRPIGGTFPALGQAGAAALLVVSEPASLPPGAPAVSSCRLRGYLLPADGGVRDLGGLATLPTYIASASVGSDGTSYLVSIDGVTGLRVANDGTLLSASPFPIAAGAYAGPVGFDGLNYVVFVHDPVMGYFDASWTHVSPAGQVLGGKAVWAATADDERVWAVAQGPGVSLVAWTRMTSSAASTVYVTRITPGAVLDPAGITVASIPLGLAKASASYTGSDFLIVWGGQSAGVRARRLALDGGFVDPAPFIVTDAGTYPVVASGAGVSLCTWSSSSGSAYASRIAGGQLLNQVPIPLDPVPEGIEFNDGPSRPVVFDGENFRVAWPELATGTFNIAPIHTRRISPDGGLLESASFTAGLALSEQHLQDVAYGAGEYLVVWTDHLGPTPDVYGMRVSIAGAFLDPQPFLVGAGATFDVWPRVAFGGGMFLVTWIRDGVPENVWVTRVTPAGVVVDDGGIPLAPPGSLSFSGAGTDRPFVSYGDQEFLVGWTYANGSASKWGVYDDLVALDGGVALSGGQRVSPTLPANATVAFDGAQHLLVFEGSSTGDPLRARRLDVDGGALDPNDLVIASGASIELRQPAVASDGQQFIVAWREASDAGDFVYAGRFTDGGLSGTPTVLAQSDGGLGYDAVAIAFDGALWHAAVADLDTGSITLATFDGQLNVLMREDAGPGFAPRLAYASPGQGMLAYSTRADPFAPQRLHLKVLCSTPDCLDAGTPDPPDAGTPAASDAGRLSDGGGGTASDGGLEPVAFRVGCGCDASPCAFVLFVALLLLRRRGVRLR